MAKAAGKGPPSKGLVSKGPAKGKGRGAGPPPPSRDASTLRPGGTGGATVATLATVTAKLRPLFWQTVAQVPEESVWTGVGPPVTFDAALLERRFALADARGKSAKNGANGHPIPGEESRKKLRVLDDRTSQLLAISFNKLPPAEQLTNVVDNLETFPEGLSAPEAIMALNTAFLDQRDAVEQLRHMELQESDLCQLDVPERYLWVMGHKPLIAAKICSGALILGLAPELPEWRQACERVMRGCQKLKASTLVRKCISTCLAVGNIMNRGTTRDGARAVVLPDGLLKLDELKGQGESEGTSGQSLLDFVSEAIVWEEVMSVRCHEKRLELHREAQDLHDALNAAKGVCLMEAETSCQKIMATARKAHGNLIQESTVMDQSVARLNLRVQRIMKEAKETSEEVAKAKGELKQQMEWFSAKANISSQDWLSSWVQFLELLAAAILRIKLPAELPLPPQPVATQPARQELKDVTNRCGVASASPKVLESKAAMQLDDDERIEVLLARMAQAAVPGDAAPKPATRVEVKTSRLMPATTGSTSTSTMRGNVVPMNTRVPML